MGVNVISTTRSIVKIISGGQTGADRAGLDAAKYLGIETGGYAPLNYYTEYGAKLNVKQSDATVIFCSKCNSSGTKNTIETCKNFFKPFIVNPTDLELVRFIDKHNVKVLNVAGNRHSIDPKIYAVTYNTIVSALSGKFIEKHNQSTLSIFYE